MGFAPPAPPSRRIKPRDGPANATVQGTVMDVKIEQPPGGLSALVSDFPAPARDTD
jgi:hypothetical protein